MEFVTEMQKKPTACAQVDLRAVRWTARPSRLQGAVHALRDLGGITFLDPADAGRGGAVRVHTGGRCRRGCARSAPSGSDRHGCGRRSRAPGGRELAAECIEVLSRPAQAMPVPVSKWTAGV